MMKTDERLSTDEVVRLVQTELTYKPGWSFRAQPCTWGSGTVDVDVSLWTIDSTDWAEGHSEERCRRALTATFHVTPGTREQVEDQLVRGIIGLENHETREFVRFSGHAPAHPHREDGRARWKRIERLPDPH